MTTPFPQSFSHAGCCWQCISFSETILVWPGHGWHQFHVPKDKAAPEDGLHSLGPQQDGPWVLSIFRFLFFSSLLGDFLWFPSLRAMLHATAWSVEQGWEFSQLLQKMDDFPKSQVFRTGKIKTQISSNLFSFFFFLNRQPTHILSLPKNLNQARTSREYLVFVKTVSGV